MPLNQTIWYVSKVRKSQEAVMNSDSTMQQQLRQSTGWGMAIGIMLIILGIVAIALPFAATIAGSILFGWLFIIAGIAQLIYTFQSRRERYFIWKLLLALLYILAGVFVLSSPIITALTLTLILGISIFVHSVIEVVSAFQMRPDRGWGWILFSGIVGIILAIFIWSEWPSSAIWFLGVWFGVNLLSDGIGLLMNASMLRSALPNA